MRGVCASLGLPVYLSVGLFATTTWAQCLLEEVSKVEAFDEGSGDWFGVSVAISQTMAVVGSPRIRGLNAGAAYVYTIEGGAWIEEVVLTASDASANDEFGWSVSISRDDAPGGRFVVVGAWDDDDACAGDPDCNSGAVYVFRWTKDGWLEEAKLVASDSASGDNFGVPVSISGDRILVGSMLDDDNGMNSGSVYIFRFNGTAWVEEAKLVAPDGEPLDWFGMSAAIAGDVAVVTALFDDDAATNAGAAYVFRRAAGEWQFETKLTASDATPLDYFGYSVALVREGAYLDDNPIAQGGGTATKETLGTQVIVVGAPDVDGGWGAAYVYRYNGREWIEEQKLAGLGGTSGQEFGTSVAMSGDTIVVGAWLDDEAGLNSGAGYLFFFDGSEWNAAAKLVSSDGAASDYLGWSVAFNGEYAVLGALGDDVPGADAGAAYLFAAADCNGNGQADGCDVAGGGSADCNANGLPDECDLESGKSNDCNLNGVPDACDLDSGKANDCNDNTVPDACDLSSGYSPDCNKNLIPDECDILDGTSEDCDQACSANGIPDECEPDCNANGIADTCDIAPQVFEIVFIMDMSTSMNEEGEVLCEMIEAIEFELSELGVPVLVTELGITFDGLDAYPCIQENVVDLLGNQVPGDNGACGAVLDDAESWGPATAIVAALYPWTRGSGRMVIPMSDEGPCRGSQPSCDVDPGTGDYDSTANAIAICKANNVIAIPITANGADDCTKTLAAGLAKGTGGLTMESTEAITGLAAAILDAFICTGSSPDCNGNFVPDECDIADETSPDDNGNGIPDECEAP